MSATRVTPTALPSSLIDAIDEFSAVRDSLDCVMSLLADMRDPVPGQPLYFLLDTIGQRLTHACALLEETRH